MCRWPYFLVLVMAGLMVGPVEAQEEDLYEKWDQAMRLRSEFRFQEAVSLYRTIIETHSGEEEVARRAWSELVFTCSQEEDPGKAEEAAREALAVYPDLQADTVYIPQFINDLYERLRSEMFGSLAILKPEGCRVFLDGELLGETPALWPYVPVGEYVMTATREKYHDYEELISVAPSGDHRLELAMSRRKDTMYWMTRVGGGALVAGTIYLFASSDSAGDTPDPLPGAPAPPE